MREPLSTTYMDDERSWEDNPETLFVISLWMSIILFGFILAVGLALLFTGVQSTIAGNPYWAGYAWSIPGAILTLLGGGMTLNSIISLKGEYPSH